MTKKILKREFEKVLVDLENLILTGVIKPRERLVETVIAGRLNVSRYWIRDALKILETKGLVEILPYKGAIVKDLDEKEIENVFAIRVVLERLAIHLAVEHITASNLRELKDLAKQFEIGYKKKDIHSMIPTNEKFHDYIFAISGNQPLINLINDLKRRLHIIRFKAWSSPDILEKIVQEHQIYLQALESKDLKLLDRIAERHISYSKHFYLSQLRTIRSLVERP